MAHKLVVGVFGSVEDAERAKTCLLDAGVSGDRIALSTNLTADAIAAEYPGQSYCNQPGQPEDPDNDRRCDAAHAGACVLRVDLGAVGEGRSIEELLRRCGSRDTSLVA